VRERRDELLRAISRWLSVVLGKRRRRRRGSDVGERLVVLEQQKYQYGTVSQAGRRAGGRRWTARTVTSMKPMRR